MVYRHCYTRCSVCADAIQNMNEGSKSLPWFLKGKIEIFKQRYAIAQISMLKCRKREHRSRKIAPNVDAETCVHMYIIMVLISYTSSKTGGSSVGQGRTSLKLKLYSELPTHFKVQCSSCKTK